MSILNPANGVLYCTQECAHAHDTGEDISHLRSLGEDEYDPALYGIYCPYCLQPYDEFMEDNEYPQTNEETI